MSERPGAGRNITGAFRNRERGGRRSGPAEAPVERAPAAPKQQRNSKKRGGKRGDPSYTQVSALVRKDVKARFAVAHAQASLEEDRELEFGELVNLLMSHFAVGKVNVQELRASLGELLQE